MADQQVGMGLSPCGNPGTAGSLTDRHVEDPWSCRRATAPQVALVAIGRQRLATPGGELPGCGDVYVPAPEQRIDVIQLRAKNADVDVLMVSPGSAEVELQGMASADPPAEGSCFERLSDRLDCERLPQPELFSRHCCDRTAALASVALRSIPGRRRRTIVRPITTAKRTSAGADVDCVRGAVLGGCHRWSRAEFWVSDLACPCRDFAARAVGTAPSAGPIPHAGQVRRPDR